MPLTKYVLTGEDSAAIALVTGGTEPRADQWADERLDAVRQRIKRFYVVQQGHSCCYCRKKVSTERGRVWDLEHILPRSIYPQFSFVPENLAIACIDCNSAKTNGDPLSGRCVGFPSRSGYYSIIHPHYDEWGEHIRFGGTVFVAKSDKGAATILMCKLWRYYSAFGADTNRIENPRLENEIDRLLTPASEDDAEASLAAIRVLVHSAIAKRLVDNA